MAPYERTLQSKAYEDMREKHPVEFAPASVFFTHDARSAIDRRNSFRVKAALVYEALTGRHVDDQMLLANKLLLALAEACHTAIRRGSSSPQEKDNPAGNGATKTQGTDGGPAATTQGDRKEKTGDEAGTQAQQKKENEAGTQAQQKKENEAGTQAQQKKENAELVSDEDRDAELKRVVDAIFLVVGFLPELMTAIRGNDRDRVDESFRSRHMHDIVTDVIKLENQVPLSDLLGVARVVEGAVKTTVGRDDFKGLKDVVGEYKDKLELNKYSFDYVVSRFCWYYSPFSSTKPSPPAPAPAPAEGKAAKTDDEKMASRTLLDCLHKSVVPLPPEAQGFSRAAGSLSSMPTARELRRSGIRFQASDTGCARIEFMEQESTLTLPVLVYDFKLATVAHNLRARELEDQSKPVTRYFQMMNELVRGVADARILRRARVLRGGEQGAHALIQSIEGQAKYPSVYVATDRQIEMVRRHHEKRMKNFFVRNRPGVIWASSVAAVSVVAVVAARRIRG